MHVTKTHLQTPPHQSPCWSRCYYQTLRANQILTRICTCKYKANFYISYREIVDCSSQSDLRVFSGVIWAKEHKLFTAFSVRSKQPSQINIWNVSIVDGKKKNLIRDDRKMNFACIWCCNYIFRHLQVTANTEKIRCYASSRPICYGMFLTVFVKSVKVLHGIWKTQSEILRSVFPDMWTVSIF